MELCPGGTPSLWDESDLKRAFVALSHVKKTLRDSGKSKNFMCLPIHKEDAKCS